MKDIYARTPINGTASSVVAQAGCANTDEATPEQQRDNLLAIVAKLREELKTLPKTKATAGKRKALGKQIADTNLKISELKAYKRREITAYILEVAKEEMTTFQWQRIVEKAQARAEEEAK